ITLPGPIAATHCLFLPQMPTLAVSRDLLFERIGRAFTDDQFDDLCFRFGIELDEITSERQQAAREQGAAAGVHLSDEAVYKIELPANRYDLLSLEGLAEAIRCYLGGQSGLLGYKVLPPVLKVHVRESVKRIRPFVVAAVLRNISFTQE